MNTPSFSSPQQGAALFVALIILLVITLLSVSSVREVTLESRITGNFVQQQQLFNAAESGLREGELAVTAGLKPLEPVGTTCSATSVCLLSNAPTVVPTFAASANYGSTNSTTAPTGTAIRWYAVPVPAGGSERGASENPEYGNMMQGIGTFRYEVNSRSQNSSNTEIQTIVRSTVAKVFN